MDNYNWDRPKWDDYFMGLAFVISTRSLDPRTRHGCVLVNSDNKIVGTGYNSYPKYIDESLLPSTSPEKYKWILHAEINAILNKVGGAYTAYVTGKCCLNCLINLYQANIREVVMYGDEKSCGWAKAEEEKEDWDKFCDLANNDSRYDIEKDFVTRFIKPDLLWLKNVGFQNGKQLCL